VEAVPSALDVARDIPRPAAHGASRALSAAAPSRSERVRRTRRTRSGPSRARCGRPTPRQPLM
jgi:hypothetical protein